MHWNHNQMGFRVRNSANPFVRDNAIISPDKSNVRSYMVIRRTSPFFDGNLKLGLLKSRKETTGSLAHPMQTQMTPMCLLLACCRMQLVAGDNTSFFESGLRFSNLSACRGRSFCRRSLLHCSQIGAWSPGPAHYYLQGCHPGKPC